MTNGSTPAGWYQDPTGQGNSRYWNGVAWTQSVDRGGVTVNAPIDPAQAKVPPTPGTQVARPAQYAPPPATPAPVVHTSSSDGSFVGVLLGVALFFFAILLIYAIVSNNDSDSGGETPGTEPTAEPTEPPAEG